MSLVNHLKDVDGQSLFMAVAYGLHMVSGQLTKSLRTGSDPTHVVTVQQMLGRGPWDGCEGLWFRGLEIDPADYEFYPGIQSTGMSDPEQPQDSVFDTDTPHSGFAWLRAELPAGVPDFDTKGSPPVGLAGKFRTMKCFDYNNDGTTKGSAGYTTNPALQVADLICRLGGRPSSRIDWPAWEEWRDFLAEEIDYDYTAIPDFEGIGLWVSLYSGADFDTFVKNRVDPYVEFVSSAGSPDIEIPVDNFSARYEGKIRPKYTQTYTFYITHTHGARVYVNDLVTPLIDQWGTTGTHSATIALTADQLYNIRVDWRHTTGNAELRLEWESSSQAREVVPHRALYPKTVQRPRYETHPFFPGPTRLDDAVRTVLNLCNSTYQEVNGKLRFFCLEQLTATSFRFTNSVIVNGSLQLIPRDPLNLRNSWQARFRDVDSQYLEEPIDPVIIERQDLIETAGRRIDGQLLELYNTTPHQAWRTLDALVKRSCDRVFDAKLTGLADTYKVLPGDAVSLDIEFLDENARPMLVVEAADNSSEQTADEREFLLYDWTGQALTEPDADVLLLDKLSVLPNRAFSFRKLRAAYAGPCCRVRTSATSGTFTDIPFDTDGWVDEAAMAAVGSPVFVLFYDQTGNGNHQQQLGGNGIPQVYSNQINSRPGIGTGSAFYIDYGDLSAFTEGEHFLLMKRDADPPSGNGALHVFNTAVDINHVPFSNGIVYDGFGSNVRKTTVDPTPSFTSWRLYSAYSAAGDWANYVDGTQIYSTATNTVGFPASSYLVGESDLKLAGEHLLFDEKLGTTDRDTIFADIESAYGLTF